MELEKFGREKSSTDKSPTIGSTVSLRDFRVPHCVSCARRSQRPSGHTVFDSFTANRIRQLRFSAFRRLHSRPTGSPLQGECRRFDPVSTHQSNQSRTRFSAHPVSRSTVIAGLFQQCGGAGKPAQRDESGCMEVPMALGIMRMPLQPASTLHRPHSA